jgi:DNA-binding transcriptional LysR family regulator
LSDKSFETEAGAAGLEQEEKSGRVRIIVIDTLTNILSPLLAASATQGK